MKPQPLRPRLMRRTLRCGAAASEYMLILALVVLPIGLLLPMFMKMVKLYGGRMTSLIGLPFP